MFSAILETIYSAIGTVGPTQVPANEWHTALYEDQPAQHRRSMCWSRWQLAFHATVSIVDFATGQWVLPLLLTFVSFIATWANYGCTMPQHCGLTDNAADFRKCVRPMTMI